MEWKPDKHLIEKTHIYQSIAELGLKDYKDFYRWSIENRDDFWEYTLKKLGIRFHKPYEKISDLSQGVENPVWLPGAEMNIAESCFQADGRRTAVVYASEKDPGIRTISYAELERRVDDVLFSMKKAGLKPGDYVGIDMSMNPEAVVIFLAALKGGMPVITVADSFAPEQIAIRFSITEPKLVFTQDYLYRNGKHLPLYEKIKQAEAPATVVIPVSTKKIPLRPGDQLWPDFLHSAPGKQPYHYASPMEDIIVLFSSGTTSEPKAIPWNHVTAVKSAADAYYHHDIHPGETVAWPTNLGWMMGPWLIFASLVNRATMALFDGVPTGDDFIRFVEKARVNMLGTVPGIVRAWRKNPAIEKSDWSAVKCFSSTGETSHPADMAWLMQVPGGRPVIEYCGGTEIGGGYITSTLVQPNYPSTFSTPALGSEIVILDENLRETDAGEVFLIPPAPGLSVKLLNKDHHQTYYAGLPPYKGKTLRRHGDYLVRMPNGYFRVMGRTDDSMNLGGIKIGSGQIEEVINDFDFVKESAAIAVYPEEGGPAKLVIYTVTHKPADPTELKKLFQQAIRQKLNPLFKVHDVVITGKLPRTASGKIMRRLLRKDYGNNE